MKKKSSSTPFVNMGTSLLLVVFLVLTLVTFAVLSLSSAKSDYDTNQRMAEHKKQYYEASTKAQVVVSKIDRLLEEESKKQDQSDLIDHMKDIELNGIPITATVTPVEDSEKGVEKNSSEHAIKESTIDSNGDSATDSKENFELSLKFSVPMSDSQALEVVLSVNDFKTADTFYEIESWQVVSTDHWDGDQTIQLLNPGTEK